MEINVKWGKKTDYFLKKNKKLLRPKQTINHEIDIFRCDILRL